MDRAEFDALLDYVVPIAQEQLGKIGDFAPFAAALNGYGTVDTVSGQGGESIDFEKDVVDLLVKALRHHAVPRGYKATAICYSANVREPEAQEAFKAIGVRMEHSEGESMVVYLPYEKDSDGSFKYGELLGSQSEPRVFNDLKSN